MSNNFVILYIYGEINLTYLLLGKEIEITLEVYYHFCGVFDF